MIELIRPMLAPTKKPELNTLVFPLLASTKIDGIRALCRRNPATGKPELVSRTLKPIPNKQTQERFAKEEYIGLDGELVVGNPYDKNLMQQTTSGCMSEDGEPNAQWHVFDKWDMDAPFYLRADAASKVIRGAAVYELVWVSQHMVYGVFQLTSLEEQWLEQGYEGMMLRSPNGFYKMNRATLKEGTFYKIKRFEDSEAVILGVKEQQTNTNEATTDERGFTKRSTHNAGKVDAGILGALLVRDTKTGVEFELGGGFSSEQRKNLWQGKKHLPGMLVKYKHFPIGVKDKPRFPVFISFRDARDM